MSVGPFEFDLCGIDGVSSQDILVNLSCTGDLNVVDAGSVPGPGALNFSRPVPNAATLLEPGLDAFLRGASADINWLILTEGPICRGLLLICPKFALFGNSGFGAPGYLRFLAEEP